MLESARRRLWLALTVSVLVHAGLLTTVVTVSPARFVVAAKPVEAVINFPERATPAGVAAPVPAATRDQQRRRTAQQPQPQPISGQRIRTEMAVREPGARPAALAPAANGKPEHWSLAASEVTAEPARAAPEATPASASAATAGRAGVSADDLRQYRVALAIAARRFKRYPPVARERGWEGRVEVAVSVSAWQPAPGVSLVRSSGRAELDEQALSMLEHAAAATILPESLKGKDLRVSLAIEFSLADDR